MRFTLDILLPIAGIIALAILLPRLLGRLLPETPPAVWLNGALCAVVLSLASAAYFFLAHLAQSDTLLGLVGLAPGETALHFLRLGLSAGIVWGPVMVLSVSTVPKRWKEGTW